MAQSVTREFLERLLRDSPFQEALKLKLDAFDHEAQTVTLRAVYGEHVERQPGTGQYHGGVSVALMRLS
jgi:acyl-coenzyme A thioesterase PaaI-like protein